MEDEYLIWNTNSNKFVYSCLGYLDLRTTLATTLVSQKDDQEGQVCCAGRFHGWLCVYYCGWRATILN